MVSIIIPVYNGQAFISSAIESAISQTYKDIEIIVVDDGSTDSTAQKILQLAESDHRIIYVHQSNRGPSAARNNGINLCRGEYIVFLDSDDILPEHYIEKLITNAPKNDMTVCGLKLYSQTGCIEILPKSSHYSCGQFISDALVGDISPLVAFTGPVARMYRSNIIKSNNIRFNTAYRYGEDTLFNLQYLAFCKNITTTEQTYYHVNQQPVSLSNSNNMDKFNAYKDIKREMETLLEITGLKQTYIEKHSSMYFVDNFFARANEIMNTANDRIWKEKHLSALLASGIITANDIENARGKALAWKLLKFILKIENGKALLRWFILAPKMGV